MVEEIDDYFFQKFKDIASSKMQFLTQKLPHGLLIGYQY